MSGAPAVVFALVSGEKTAQAAGFSDLPESFALSSGEEFVNVSLVGDVENELIFRSGKNAMQGDRQFDDAEIRADVAAVDGGDFEDFLSDFSGERRELFRVELLEIGRTENLRQNRFASMGNLFGHGWKLSETSGIGFFENSCFALAVFFEEFDFKLCIAESSTADFQELVPLFVFAQEIVEGDFAFLHRFHDLLKPLKRILETSVPRSFFTRLLHNSTMSEGRSISTETLESLRGICGRQDFACLIASDSVLEFLLKTTENAENRWSFRNQSVR